MDWSNLLTTERFSENGNRFSKNDTKKEYSFKKYNRGNFTCIDDDYQTIIRSASFRRLQDKTQVFPLEKNDFVRTRLTHSIETSAIAKKLGNMVLANISLEKNKNNNSYKDYQKNKEEMSTIPDLLACAGLIHDIGNPPFGHFGEVVMSDWFKDNIKHLKYKGKQLEDVLTKQQLEDLYHLDGNAQALRVVGKLHDLHNESGMNLTKSLLNILVKYPVKSTEIDKGADDIKYHKLGYYASDFDMFDDIAQSTGTKLSDNEYARHPLTYLLEAADDIAYATADVEDGLKKNYISVQDFINVFEQIVDEKDEKDEKNRKNYLLLQNLKEQLKKDSQNELQVMQEWLDNVRDWLEYNAVYSFTSNYNAIMKGTYTKELLSGVINENILKVLKEVANEYLFANKEINKVELSGSVILEFLLNKFVGAILEYDEKNIKMTKENKKIIGLLSQNHMNVYNREKEKCVSEGDKIYLKLHLVIDYISGMTDSYAKRLCQELRGVTFFE
ncbi:deoxyguanosinetriphosphate triphosphohydrolase [Faecalibacillus faecis]|uniref:deoxyguanosinetriphosphate triphosphohydrolase n=1 Tax=Faecalibacillus faecis TaxID=1982628 RepID=UPI0022E48154|nr:deoxyguanosinetriphosphate triphosphohydrolase [Faecalibacillus faecis]